MNASSTANCTECSAAALSKKLLERPFKLAEIAALSEKCDLWNPRKHVTKETDQPLTFVVPVFQLVASIPRYVEVENSSEI
jgi:hypothetical protein